MAFIPDIQAAKIAKPSDDFFNFHNFYGEVTVLLQPAF
jgi:hypothetical protein